MPRLAAGKMRRTLAMGSAPLVAVALLLLAGCAGPLSGDATRASTANLPAEIAPPDEQPTSLPALPADPTLESVAAESLTADESPRPFPTSAAPATPLNPAEPTVAEPTPAASEPASPPSTLEELARIALQITGEDYATTPPGASPSDLPAAPQPPSPPAELPDYVQLAPADGDMPTTETLAAPLPPAIALTGQLDPLEELLPPAPPTTDDGLRTPPGPLPLADQPEHVGAARSLEQLVDLAMMHHPALVAATARLRATEGQWVQAGLRPNPQVGYVAEEINSGGTAGLQGVGVSRTFITGGKLELARMTADGQRLLASQQMEIVRGRVLGDVHLAYYDALAAQERVSLARQLVAMSEEAERNVQQLLNAGFAGQADVLRAQVEVQSNRVRLTDALARQEAAYRQIAAVTGQPHLDATRITGDLAEGPADASHYSWDRLLARLQRESPEVSAAVARIERARRAVRQACSQVTPDINAQLSLLFDDETDDWVTGAGISIPLMVNNRNQGNITAAQAQLREAEAELARIELNLQQRLASTYADYSAARQEAERYASEVLPLASRSRETIFSAFEQGELSYLDYLAAQQTDFNSRLAYLDALQRQRKAEALLDSLLLSGGLAEAPQ